MNMKGELIKEDYIYCMDCDEYVDYYKYDNLEDAGHDKCNWRYVNETELKECIKECKEVGCLDE